MGSDTGRRKRVEGSGRASRRNAQFKVAGAVRSTSGGPIVRAVVRAYDRDLPSLERDELLGETPTDQDGRYVITYTQAQFRRTEKSRADLLVRVFDDTATRPLAASRTIFNARDTETVNLVVQGGVSEYQRLMRDITPLLGGLSLSKLTEDDHAFLAGELKTNRQHVRFLSEAQRLSREAKKQGSALPPEVFYGLLRERLPPELAGLLAQPEETHRHALEAAVRDNIITLAATLSVETILGRLRKLTIKRALEPSTTGAKPGLGELLRASSLPTNRHETFAGLYVRHQGPASKFWDALRRHPEFKEGSLVDELRLTFQLDTLTRRHLPLLKKLQSKRQLGEWTSLRDLAKYDVEDWEATVRERDVGVPAGMPGDTNEQMKSYAAAIARSIQKALPTAVVASLLTKAARPDEQDLVRFLKNNNPHFDFGSTHVDSFLAGPDGEAALAGVNDREALTRDLKRWQRVFNVTSRFEEIRVLMDGGMHSGFQIAGKGQAGFQREFGGAFGDRANEILDAATGRSALAQAVYGRYAPWANFRVQVIPHPPSQVENFSDWASLFGSLSFCECEHCRSVLSPAAYLVDLLHFFKDKGLRLSKVVDGRNSERLAIDVLLERRPDIAQIQLSCANTNTAVPYVDLVNEILANAIAPMRETPQTNNTAGELEVNPEHVNVDADNALADAIYPWTLPFDLYAAEIRAYLEHLGTPRHDLMQVFQRERENGADPQPTAIEIVTDRLGLTSREWDIITGAAPESAWQLWGYAQIDGWVGDVRNVLTFQQRSGLSYAELLELLSLRYIRGNADIGITFAAACNLDGAFIDATLDAAALKRAHCFLRLQRKLNWTMRELDQTITALQPDGLNNDFLVEVAFIKSVQQELNVPLVNMLAWWGRRVDTTRYLIQGQPETPTLYSQLFLNKTITNPDDDASFVLGDNGEPPASTLSEHIAALTAALGITEGELSLLTSAARALELLNLPASEVPDDTLNVVNVSHLYRVVSFSRALGLSLRDFLTLKALTGIRALARVSPLATGSPEHTLRFVQATREVRSSGFSIPELDYLLRHVDQTPRRWGPTEDQVAVVLLQLASGLDRVVAETTFETVVVVRDNVEITIGSVPAGPLLRDKLAILLPADVVDAVCRLIDRDPALSDPEGLIREHLALFLDAESAITSLVGVGATIQDPEARIAYVLVRLMAHLRRISSERVVKQTLATKFGIDTAAMHALLIEFVRSPADPVLRAIDEFLLRGDANDPVDRAERFRRQFKTYLRLHKIATVIERLGIRANELSWVFAHGEEAGWLALASLPTALPAANELAQALETWKARFDGWSRLCHVYRLLHKLPALRDPLTPDDWQRLAIDFNVTARLDVGAPALFNLFSFAAAFDEANWSALAQAVLLDVLASRTGWSAPDLLHLAGDTGLNVALPTGARNELALGRIDACFTVAKRLGVSVDHLSGWARTIVDRDTAREIAMSIKRTVKAKYSAEQWPAVAKPIRDVLREEHRAALVSFLTSHSDHAGRTFQDTNDLFNYFLIDVEMSACMATSRIRQAIGSVQLFIQRCLMNLEEAGAPLAGEDWATYWRWMKNYRVWEANRQVFLYPENWIRPELRDDKSPFFTALESDLLQKEMTTATAESAFSSYLEKLDEVARLEIVGMYQETENTSPGHPVLERDPNVQNTAVEELQQKLNAWGADPPLEVNGVFQDATDQAVRRFQGELGLEVNGVVGAATWAALDRATGALATGGERRHVLHVVGRTRHDPYVHYYRTRVDTAWTPWERVDLDIPEKHVVPVMWNRRLYLFWPIFSEKVEETAVSPESDGPSETPPAKYWEVQIAWSEYSNRKWSAKKLSPVSFVNKDLPIMERHEGVGFFHPASSFTFKGIVDSDSDSLVIRCYVPDPFANPDEDAAVEIMALAEFRVTPSAGSVDILALPGADVIVSPLGTIPENMTFVEAPDGVGELRLVTGRSIDGPIYSRALGPTAGQFALAYPHQDQQFSSDTRPFFYQDGRRTFFVTSATETVTAETMEGSFSESWTSYQFRPFYHPYVTEFVSQMNRYGLDRLLDPGGADHRSWQLRRQLLRRDNFEDVYGLQVDQAVVRRPYPVEDVDVSETGAYALYNWELFFHAPLLIADRLSTNQRFEEAQKWFHYIFDPTERSNEQGTRRYWKFRKFYEDARFYDRAEEHPPTVEELMANVPELEEQVDQWRKHPFNPHLIARMRTTAYQKAVVMKYIDNLIAWGDQLFRRDTRESVGRPHCYISSPPKSSGSVLRSSQPTMSAARHTPNWSPTSMHSRTRGSWRARTCWWRREATPGEWTSTSTVTPSSVRTSLDTTADESTSASRKYRSSRGRCNSAFRPTRSCWGTGTQWRTASPRFAIV